MLFEERERRNKILTKRRSVRWSSALSCEASWPECQQVDFACLAPANSLLER